MPLNSDTLQIIQDTAVKASDAKGKVAIVHPDAEPAHVYLTVNAQGTTNRLEAQPAPRGHVLRTLEEVPKYAARIGTEDGSVVWFDRTAIVIVLDDTTRRDKVTMPLKFTPQMRSLFTLEKDKPKFTQTEIVRLLRVDLADCRIDDRLLNWVRSCRFNTTANAGGQVKHGRESLGRDIDESIVGGDGGECPEEIRFDVRVFDDPLAVDKWEVRCAVELIVSEQSFRITPYPMQCDNAVENEVTAIGKYLTDQVKCPLFRGTPS